ncbi:MAG: hypothetical protein AB7E80_08710 [Hyphomicrobiaceae bacterium]
MKRLSALALTVAAAAAFGASVSQEAQAGRKQCVYFSRHVWNGNMVADGWAKASSLSTACDRAHRRCNRERDRRLRDGVPAGACTKVGNLSG